VLTLNKKYLFTSERLGFRNWLPADLELMHQINSDPDVMQFFPGLTPKEKTADFIIRMQNEFKEKNFCYFAVDNLESGGFIGFIGLHEQVFESDFTPCVDIGWRLAKKEWNKGYGTEGAKRCIIYGFQNLGLKKIISITPKINLKSEFIMKKIGMNKIKYFKHPGLAIHKNLEECVLYEILNGA
jgi:RimJ/RimL family protein N-acetyltransferase